MTREEEINIEAKNRYLIDHPFIDIARASFIEGAKWADSHPMFYKGQTRKMMDSEVEFTDEWFKNHKEQPTYADAIEWAINNPPKGTSLIKWQTGEPKENGRYLVQTNSDGLQIAIWSSFVKTWSLYNESEITAWCRLSDVEPYKD